MSKLLWQVEMPLLFVLFRMEQAGFMVDRDFLRGLGEQYTSEIESSRQAVFTACGVPPFTGAPAQVAAGLAQVQPDRPQPTLPGADQQVPDQDHQDQREQDPQQLPDQVQQGTAGSQGVVQHGGLVGQRGATGQIGQEADDRVDAGPPERQRQDDHDLCDDHPARQPHRPPTGIGPAHQPRSSSRPSGGSKRGWASSRRYRLAPPNGALASADRAVSASR